MSTGKTISLEELVSKARVRAHKFAVELDVAVPANAGAFEVSGIVSDSREVKDGMLYCAVTGERFDGHDFVTDAIERGARAVLVERSTSSESPELRTGDVRKTMPWLASSYWQDPSDNLAVVGVTGTNGKTTITTMLGHIASVEGRGGTVIGTLSGERTTPEAPDLQRRLARGVELGHALAAVEVSSHALDQHRADAVNFAVGVFTNLSVDHLDYHDTMENYFAAKAKLFDGRCRHAIIVVVDEWGERLAKMASDAEIVRPESIPIESLHADGSVFFWRDRRIELPLAGDFNVANALCAAEAARSIGFAEDLIVEGLETIENIRGRMDRVPGLPHGFPTVYVDYSHTPDGLRHALNALRPLTPGKLVCVFGAGGDRDATKRPLMGNAAEQGSDITIVTSDNPRSEDPSVIAEQVLSGMSTSSTVLVEHDRRAAIELALRAATTGDVVLVAGKGHETTQTMKEKTVPFDDRLVVQELAMKLAHTRKDAD